MSARYALRRIAQLGPTLAAILVVTFFLVHLAPGDPVRALAGDGGSAEYYERMRDKYDLDEPLPVQLGSYVWNAVRGDLGRSFAYRQPASSVIWDALQPTLLLASTAFLLSTIAGLALGLLAARRPGGRLDTTSNLGALIAHATPNFVLAQLALLLLAFRLGWFPTHGMNDARSPGTGLSHVLDVAHHLVLPALVLAVHDVAIVMRLTRTRTCCALGRDHVRAARAKGATERRVLVHHALPGALLPVLTVVGGRVGGLLSGAAIIEIVFGWPGIGRLVLTAAQSHDYPVLLGILLLVAATAAVANLLVDLLYARVDPRVHYD